jgi:pentatricopeptide repeat protein
MESKGIKTNCVIVSTILQYFCEKGMHSQVVEEFKRFKDLRIFLDEVSYNIVVDALCKLEKVDQAVALLDEMKGKQMDMDIMHYTTLINGYCHVGKLVDAFRVFEEMEGKGLEPDVVTFNILLAAFSRRGLANEALKLYEYMKSQDLKPNAITHNVMIEGLCIGGKVTEAEAFFCNMEDKSIDNYGAMITGYCEAKHTEKASELFFELSERGLLMDRGYIYKLLEKLCEEGEKDRALWLLKTMLDLNMEPSKDMYGKVITACYRAGDMRNAEAVFDILRKSGLTPDIFTYTTMINVCCRQNRLSEARNLFQDMKHRGIKPDLVTFTVLLDGHLKRVHSEAFARKRKEVNLAASNIWKEMQNTEIRPDVICYTALIDGHCKVDRLEDAIGLYDEMMYRGVEPDRATCTALLSGCRNRGDVDMVLTKLNLINLTSVKEM